VQQREESEWSFSSPYVILIDHRVDSDILFYIYCCCHFRAGTSRGMRGCSKKLSCRRRRYGAVCVPERRRSDETSSRTRRCASCITREEAGERRRHRRTSRPQVTREASRRRLFWALSRRQERREWQRRHRVVVGLDVDFDGADHVDVEAPGAEPHHRLVDAQRRLAGSPRARLVDELLLAVHDEPRRQRRSKQLRLAQAPDVRIAEGRLRVLGQRPGPRRAERPLLERRLPRSRVEEQAAVRHRHGAAAPAHGHATNAPEVNTNLDDALAASHSRLLRHVGAENQPQKIFGSGTGCSLVCVFARARLRSFHFNCRYRVAKSQVASDRRVRDVKSGSGVGSVSVRLVIIKDVTTRQRRHKRKCR